MPFTINIINLYDLRFMKTSLVKKLEDLKQSSAKDYTGEVHNYVALRGKTSILFLYRFNKL